MIQSELDVKRQIYKELLHTRVAEVEFIKVNGEHRMMSCTLNPELIPPAPIKVLKEGEVVKPPRPENLEVLRVFDVEKQEWRSFRIDSVININ